MLNDAAVNVLCEHRDVPTFEDLILQILLKDEKWTWRSVKGICGALERDGRQIAVKNVEAVIAGLRADARIVRCPHHNEMWGHPDRVTLECHVYDVLLSHPNYTWRSVASIAKRLRRTNIEIENCLVNLCKQDKVRQNPVNDEQWGCVERVGPMEMSKEERLPGEQELWDKAHPVSMQQAVIDPSNFLPVPVVNVAPVMVYSKDNTESCRSQEEDFAREPSVCESRQQGFGFVPDEEAAQEKEMLPRHRRQHRQHMRELSMVIDKLPTGLIVKALSDAMSHAREVGEREHIKADRIERVNQFVVSLRRQFGYMGDNYRTEREFLSAQLARKEVWYDVGVLNPTSISGLGGATSYLTSLKQRDVEGWLAQAEAMTPSFGDLKSEIEKDLSMMKGSILVAEACNKTTGELNRVADKVLGEMAVLAADM